MNRLCLTMIFVVATTIGCANSGSGGGSSGGGDSAPYKALQSNWVNSTNDQTHVDLTYTILFSGIANTTYFYLAGGKCDVNFVVPSGSNGEGGTFTVSSSTYTGTGNGGVDPGCSTLVGSYTYTNIAAELSLCPVATPTTCNKYH